MSWKRDNKEKMRRRITLAAVFLAALAVLAYTARAVDVVSNGHFDTDLSGWTHTNAVAEGTRDRDATVGGVSPGSLRYLTNTGRRMDFEGDDVTPLGTINSTDVVTLSFWWSKYADVTQATEEYIEPLQPGKSNLAFVDRPQTRSGSVARLRFVGVTR